MTMLAASHTGVLMKMSAFAGCPPGVLLKSPGSLMAFGNILPDALPIIGVPAELSHDALRADRARKCSPPVGLGIMAHLWADNITHCGALENCGDYSKGFAIDQGVKWENASSGRFNDLLDRIEGKSRPYILHIIIEIAADVLSATDDALEIIEKAWESAYNHSSELMPNLGRIYGIGADLLAKGVENYPPSDWKGMKNVYSRPMRAGLFMRKFAPDLKDKGVFSDDDRERVLAMIELGEETVRDDLDAFLTDCARRIFGHSADVRDLFRRASQ